MIDLCIHSDNIGEAYDIQEIFYHHSKVKEEPQIFFKIQTYKQPGKSKLEKRRSYLTAIRMRA